MGEKLRGWEEKEKVSIPPLETNGFASDVIIREPVRPIREQNPSEDLGEDPTVILNSPIRVRIRRMRTDETAEIDKESFVIGKSVEADFVVKENPTVSRKHARIFRTEEGYCLEDLNSSNHVYVDGEQIHSPVRLADGSVFRLSQDEEFEFTVRAD